MEHNILASIAALGDNLGARLDPTAQTVSDLANGVQGEIRRATAAEEKLFQHFSKELEATNDKLHALEEKFSVLTASVEALAAENKSLKDGSFKASPTAGDSGHSSYNRPFEARILQCNAEYEIPPAEFVDTLEWLWQGVVKPNEYQISHAGKEKVKQCAVTFLGLEPVANSNAERARLTLFRNGKWEPLHSQQGSRIYIKRDENRKIQKAAWGTKIISRLLRSASYGVIKEYRREGLVEIDGVSIVKILAEDPSAPPLLAWRRSAAEAAWLDIAKLDGEFRSLVKPRDRSSPGDEPFIPLG